MTKVLWTTKAVADALCERRNISTDYGLAKFLGIDTNTAAGWRKGQRIMSDDHAAIDRPSANRQSRPRYLDGFNLSRTLVMKKTSSQPPKKPRAVPRFSDAGLHFRALDGTPARIETPEAARLTGSSVRTVNRWRRAGRIPAAPLMLLQLHHAGLVVPEAWQRRGARFDKAGVLQVGAYSFHASELDGYGVMLAALRELQVLRARERAQQRADAARGPSLIILPGGR